MPLRVQTTALLRGKYWGHVTCFDNAVIISDIAATCLFQVLSHVLVYRDIMCRGRDERMGPKENRYE